MHNPNGRRREQDGFTLLEMLLVVFILGMLAFSATAIVDNQDDQLRFEDTGKRLEWIRAAVLGTSVDIPAGFVANNGLMPSTINQLLELPIGYAPRALYSPLFDSDPDPASGLNNGVNEVTVSFPLEKGWTPNLHKPPGSSGFGDAWRSAGTAPNYNWQVDSLSAPLTVASLGKDGAVGGVQYNADVSDSLLASHWGAEIAGYSTLVSNQTGADLVDVRVSMLVFINSAASETWKRYTSGLLPILTNGTAATVVFPAGGYPGGSYLETRVPIGRHLLVLVQDDTSPNTDAHNGTTETLHASNSLLPLICSYAGCPVQTMVIR